MKCSVKLPTHRPSYHTAPPPPPHSRLVIILAHAGFSPSIIFYEYICCPLIKSGYLNLWFITGLSCLLNCSSTTIFNALLVGRWRKDLIELMESKTLWSKLFVTFEKAPCHLICQCPRCMDKDSKKKPQVSLFLGWFSMSFTLGSPKPSMN